MLLVFHVLTALSSLAYTAYVFISPSKTKLQYSYGLVALTLASGSYLVWSTKAAMISACTTGLVYLTIVFFGIVSAKNKLARQENRFDQN